MRALYLARLSENVSELVEPSRSIRTLHTTVRSLQTRQNQLLCELFYDTLSKAFAAVS